MDPVVVLSVVLRWLHVIAASLVIGGVFFLRVVLPRGLEAADAAAGQAVYLRCRRFFKRLVHTCILFLLLSGVYNSVRLFPQYSAQPGLLHGLWGLHILLGLAVFGISVWLLAGDEPPRSHRKWVTVNLVLLMVLAAVASALKTVRESGQARTATAPTATQD